MSDFNVADIVKNSTACGFHYYRQQHMYYRIHYNGITYSFPIPIDDVGNGTLEMVMKPLTLMRWIRLSIDQGTFIKEV